MCLRTNACETSYAVQTVRSNAAQPRDCVFIRASDARNDSVRRMNTEIIAETARATLAGAISFPEVVKNLLGTGVEYYHVDYVALEKTFYSDTGAHVTTPITF